MSTALQILNMELDADMQRIAKRLGPKFRLTLICRYSGDDLSDADIVKSDDSFDKAEAAMRRLAGRAPIGAPR